MMKTLMMFLCLVMVAVVTVPHAFALDNMKIDTVNITDSTGSVTQWAYLHGTEGNASRLVIELGGGRVMIDPFDNYTLVAMVEDTSHGLGGFFTPQQIDELILVTVPRSFLLTVGGSSLGVGDWIIKAVLWAHTHNYTQTYGFGYSAGATLWVRYLLGDDFGRSFPANESLTGVIAKAYANQSCIECSLYARNITTPILFLQGTEDSVATLAGAEGFYNQIPNSTLKMLLTYPDDHQGMGDLLPSDAQKWILDPSQIPEFPPEALFWMVPLLIVVAACCRLTLPRLRYQHSA